MLPNIIKHIVFLQGLDHFLISHYLIPNIKTPEINPITSSDYPSVKLLV